ncbi:MAG: hypothetical protein ACRDIV_09290 [Ktedonobacteraceae bacterium]
MKPRQHITPVGAQTTFVDVWQWGQELEKIIPKQGRFACLKEHWYVFLEGIQQGFVQNRAI